MVNKKNSYLVLFNETIVLLSLLQLVEAIKQCNELCSSELNNQENLCLQLAQLKVSLFISGVILFIFHALFMMY